LEVGYLIKKNTRIVFEDNTDLDLEGGIPLSVGDVIDIKTNSSGGKVGKFKVKEKKIECFLDGKDQIVNIKYVLGKE
jgi:hypothetical protein